MWNCRGFLMVIPEYSGKGDGILRIWEGEFRVFTRPDFRYGDGFFGGGIFPKGDDLIAGGGGGKLEVIRFHNGNFVLPQERGSEGPHGEEHN